MQQAKGVSSGGRRKPAAWRWGLVADTDIAIGRLLGRGLPAEGFGVRLAQSAEAVLASVATRRPDVIVLGGDLPDMAALPLIARLHAELGPPLLALLTDASDFDVIQALDAGAADCMRKPFLVGELAARLRKMVRRRLMDRGLLAAIHTDSLDLDVVRWRVLLRGVEINLSGKEQAVLRVLIEDAGNVVSTRDLLVKVWHSTPRPSDGRVRPVVRSLRRKLDLQSGGAVRLLAEPQVGYRLIVPNSTGSAMLKARP